MVVKLSIYFSDYVDTDDNDDGYVRAPEFFVTNSSNLYFDTSDSSDMENVILTTRVESSLTPTSATKIMSSSSKSRRIFKSLPL